MKKQSLIKGTLILGISGVLARFLGLFFRWPLQMLIGDEGVGYYQLSYPLYMFFIAAASGIPVAVSKMVSEKRAVNDDEEVILIFRKAMLLMVVMGIGFTALLLTFSKQIIAFLKWDTKSYYSLIGIAFAPMFISIMSAFRGFYQGLQNMNPTAVSQILEQLGRIFVGVGLAYILLPKGLEYSAGGASLGAAAGGIIGGAYLAAVYVKIRKNFKTKKIRKDTQILSKLLYMAVPISLGAAVGTVMSLIDSALVPQKLLEAGFTHKQATILYGQLTGKAYTLINVPLTLSSALCASLVPIIAEAFILNRNIEVKGKVNMALKFSMVIAIPSCLGLSFMAKPILSLIFPGQSEGYEILKYLSFALPFIVIAQTTTAILQGVGKYMSPVINLAAGCIIKIIFTLTLVPLHGLNIYGAIIGTIAGYITASILNIKLLKKTLNIHLNYYDILIKPAAASILMIILVEITYHYVYNITISNVIAGILSIFSGIILYVLLIPAFGILKYDDFRRRLRKEI